MQSMSLVNQEALDSQIYNPSVDPKVLMLQQVMEKTPTVFVPPKTSVPLVNPSSEPVELREYIETFNNMTTQNAFAGVLVNPATCLFEDIRQDLVQLPILCDVKWGSDTEWTTYKPTYEADVREINQNCDIIQDHTDRLTSNLPSLTGIAQAALALSTVMNLLSNPCLGLDGMLGSIMDSGKQLLSDIKSKIRGVIKDAREWVDSKIGPILDKVKAAVANAKAKMLAFVAKAKAEIRAFGKAMLAQARQGLAELLAFLPKDPCLRGLLKSAATGAAAGIIGG